MKRIDGEPIPLRHALILLCAAFVSACGGADGPGGTAGPAAAVCDAGVPVPTVQGPVTGGVRGHPAHDTWWDETAYGYVEEEYFLEGLARAYPGDGTRDTPYKTRLLVYRPADPARWNGTVLLEWENVTGQTPVGAFLQEAHRFLLREGYAYAGISAQQAGVCCSPISLRLYDPDRYGSLSHPGDDYSYDIFNQAAQALRCPGALDPLGDLPPPGRILGAGQSQSAGRLHSYANIVRDVRVVDGLYLDVGGGLSYPADLDIPVIQQRSDAEIADEPIDAPADFYRLWEVPGSSHATGYLNWQSFGPGEAPHTQRLLLNAPKRTREQHEAFYDEHGEYGEDRDAIRASCVTGDPFPRRFIIDAAIHYLNEWAKDSSRAPPVAPRVEFENGSPRRDEFANILGGVRLPPVDVPVATYVGDRCGILGDIEPFPAAQLETLYPTHADYVAKMQEATDRAIAAGFLLPADAEELMLRAQRSVIGDLE